MKLCIHSPSIWKKFQMMESWNHFIELRSNSALEMEFWIKTLEGYWCSATVMCTRVCEIAVTVLIPSAIMGVVVWGRYLAPWILKFDIFHQMFSVKCCFLSFEWLKIKISHFCPLQRSLWLPLEIPYWPLTEKILSTLMYATTYPCESGFSTFLSIRMKSRNRLKSQADIRAAISNIVPRFEALRSQKQEQRSHWTEIHW